MTNPNLKTTQKLSREVYPEYDALWHLITMGVLDEDHCPLVASKSERPTRVAIIDTSVAVDHPNLIAAINHDLAFDLFSSRLGAFPYLPPEGTLGVLNLNVDTKVAEGLPAAALLLTELNDRLSHGSPTLPSGVQACVSPEFSNHGTAIAGLVGARPAVVDIADEHPSSKQKEFPLPYSGVDPTCEIIPISTNFDPNPESLILAFLYAELIEADVILLPRSIPDPARTVPELSSREINGVPLLALVAPASATEIEVQQWAELAQLILNISMKRPIVCAAGNANEDNGIYPANLASEHNGIISVGAVNAKGHRSGYSSGHNITVMALSNDSEVFDREEVRRDEQNSTYQNDGVPKKNNNAKYSSFDVISTDVPGRYGYSSSPYFSDEPDEGMREFGSYFCRFGGTSASSALVAGFIALGKSSTSLNNCADGPEAKSWLLSQCIEITDDDGEIFQFPSWASGVSFPEKA
ncbi:MAG: S8/S53 family peptidase [Rhizobiaceae bacterium]